MSNALIESTLQALPVRARASDSPGTPAARARSGRGDLWVLAAVAALVALSWHLGQLPLFDPRTRGGYWIGVTGGVLLLLLYTYPLRKRVRALAGLGRAKHWFAAHMVLGVLGPVIILAHTSFRFGSLNAGVALVSMIVVATSGLVGRFLYLHTHRGLGGERETLQALQIKLGLADTTSRGGLGFAPQAQESLRSLQRHAGQPGDRWREHFARLLVLPARLARERRAVRREVTRQLNAWAERERWERATTRRRLRKALRLVDGHIAAVRGVAQFAAYARIFSLWHVLHVPFLIMLFISAIVHVVAVHAY